MALTVEKLRGFLECDACSLAIGVNDGDFFRQTVSSLYGGDRDAFHLLFFENNTFAVKKQIQITNILTGQQLQPFSVSRFYIRYILPSQLTAMRYKSMGNMSGTSEFQLDWLPKNESDFLRGVFSARSFIPHLHLFSPEIIFTFISSNTDLNDIEQLLNIDKAFCPPSTLALPSQHYIIVVHHSQFANQQKFAEIVRKVTSVIGQRGGMTLCQLELSGNPTKDKDTVKQLLQGMISAYIIPGAVDKLSSLSSIYVNEKKKQNRGWPFKRNNKQTDHSLESITEQSLPFITLNATLLLLAIGAYEQAASVAREGTHSPQSLASALSFELLAISELWLPDSEKRAMESQKSAIQILESGGNELPSHVYTAWHSSTLTILGLFYMMRQKYEKASLILRDAQSETGPASAARILDMRTECLSGIGPRFSRSVLLLRLGSIIQMGRAGLGHLCSDQVMSILSELPQDWPDIRALGIWAALNFGKLDSATRFAYLAQILALAPFCPEKCHRELLALAGLGCVGHAPLGGGSITTGDHSCEQLPILTVVGARLLLAPPLSADLVLGSSPFHDEAFSKTGVGSTFESCPTEYKRNCWAREEQQPQLIEPSNPFTGSMITLSAVRTAAQRLISDPSQSTSDPATLAALQEAATKAAAQAQSLIDQNYLSSTTPAVPTQLQEDLLTASLGDVVTVLVELGNKFSVPLHVYNLRATLRTGDQELVSESSSLTIYPFTRILIQLPIKIPSELSNVDELRPGQLLWDIELQVPTDDGAQSVAHMYRPDNDECTPRAACDALSSVPAAVSCDPFTFGFSQTYDGKITLSDHSELEKAISRASIRVQPLLRTVLCPSHIRVSVDAPSLSLSSQLHLEDQDPQHPVMSGSLVNGELTVTLDSPGPVMLFIACSHSDSIVWSGPEQPFSLSALTPSLVNDCTLPLEMAETIHAAVIDSGITTYPFTWRTSHNGLNVVTFAASAVPIGCTNRHYSLKVTQIDLVLKDAVLALTDVAPVGHCAPPGAVLDCLMEIQNIYEGGPNIQFMGASSETLTEHFWRAAMSRDLYLQRSLLHAMYCSDKLPEENPAMNFLNAVWRLHAAERSSQWATSQAPNSPSDSVIYPSQNRVMRLISIETSSKPAAQTQILSLPGSLIMCNHTPYATWQPIKEINALSDQVKHLELKCLKQFQTSFMATSQHQNQIVSSLPVSVLSLAFPGCGALRRLATLIRIRDLTSVHHITSDASFVDSKNSDFFTKKSQHELSHVRYREEIRELHASRALACCVAWRTIRGHSQDSISFVQAPFLSILTALNQRLSSNIVSRSFFIPNPMPPLPPLHPSSISFHHPPLLVRVTEPPQVKWEPNQCEAMADVSVHVTSLSARPLRVLIRTVHKTNINQEHVTAVPPLWTGMNSVHLQLEPFQTQTAVFHALASSHSMFNLNVGSFIICSQGLDWSAGC